jgi:hypothetical protein
MFTNAFASPHFLRNVLRVDALSCLACGLLQVAATDAMTQVLGLPSALLAYTGEFLLLYGVAVAFLSGRTPLPRSLIGVLVVGNLGWAVACIGLLLAGPTPTALGTGYVLVQAVTVGILAELQFFGLRRSVPSPAW